MPNIHDSKYYKSLTTNIVFIIAIMSVVPLVIISGIARHYFNVSYREKVLSHIKVTITRHRQNIDNFLMERLGAIRVLAESFPMDTLVDSDFLATRLHILQGEYGSSLVDLGIIDEHGNQIAYAGPYKLQGADYSQAEWFKQAIKRDHYLSDVFLGKRKVPHFAITVTRKQDGQTRIIRANIDFEALNSLVGNLHVGSTGYAFIINSNGELQTKLPPGITSIPKDLYVHVLSEKESRGDNVYVIDDAHLDGIYMITRLKEGEWGLGFYQSAAEAFSALYSARILVVSTLFASIIIILTVAFLLSRRIVNYIEKADEDKQLMNEQLIEAGKLASLGEMAAGIAHEINNPVGIMIQEAGWIQDLVEEIEEDPKKSEDLELDEFKRSLTRIMTQGKRCRDITHKLLSFARKSDQTSKNTQLNSLIEEVVALSMQRAKYCNTKINKHLQEDLPLVKISPSEVQQILLNLINNSLDAIDTKGGAIDISTLTEGNSVIVEVSDNGPGIPRANLMRIFEPFFTTKPVGKGTGLGLSICYGIIKRLGGDIIVDSELGKGTTFRIVFPEAKESA